MDLTDVQRLIAERQQLDTLLEHGVTFTLPKRSLLRFIGGKERTFLLKQPYLGTLDYLSREFVDMEFSEERLPADDTLTAVAEAKRLMARNARRCAKVVAIAVLNNQTGIRWAGWLFTRYLLWHLTPGKLLQLAGLIQSLSNLADFTNSIRFLSVVSQTAKPQLMETKGETVA